MKEIRKSSPNYSSRKGYKPSLILLHHTAGRNSLPTLTTKKRFGNVSAHKLVQGTTVYQLVDDEHSAWHAGRSSWKGKSVYGSVNAFSLGVEIENLGNGKDPFKPETVDVVAQVVADWMTKHRIGKQDVTDHKTVSPGRKSDLAKNFPWLLFWQRLDFHLGRRIEISIIATPDRAKLIRAKVPYRANVKMDGVNETLTWICTPQTADIIKGILQGMKYNFQFRQL